MKKFAFILLLICGSYNILNGSHYSPNQNEFDLVVVGATFSGIAAAINAAQYGHQVALVEGHQQIGGLMTGGLSFTDFISFEALGGTFRVYMNRVEAYYINKYGKNSLQVMDCHRGIQAEPHVTLQVFHEMLDEHPNISVFVDHRISEVLMDKPRDNLKVIKAVKFFDVETGSDKTITGEVFIDATYEGDLAAFSGAEYRVGRESRTIYGEPLAGKVFFDKGKLLVGSNGTGDHKVQGYNYRLIMTDDPANRRMIDKPDNYDRAEFLPIAQVLKEEKVSQVFVEKSRDGIFRSQMLPNRKADVNDIKNAPVRIAMLGKNYQYPEGDWETRKRIEKMHRDHILGMLYFIQNDEAVPEKYRNAAREWGLAKDEFVDNDNFPTRLYIREARRIIGNYVFTQNEVNTIDNTLVVKLKEDAIAIGDYALNCHGVAPPSLHPSIAEGDFNYIPPPFQIPFGVLVPKGFSNMMVSVAVSASHVGFCGLRLEPTWTALGQAGGLAAHLLLKNNQKVMDVEVKELQKLLHQNQGKTIYISDIDADSKYFMAAQYFGLKGYLHDAYLMDTLQMPGVETYKSIWGTQYAHAYPFHALKPDQKLEPELADKWINRIENKTLKSKAFSYLNNNELSRGQFLLKIYELMNLN